MNSQDGASEKNRDEMARLVRRSDEAVSASKDIIDRVMGAGEAANATPESLAPPDAGDPARCSETPLTDALRRAAQPPQKP